MPGKKYIHRIIETEVLKRVKEFPALALTGPRQTGKSTLLQKIFSGYQYASLDQPLLRKQAMDDPETFLDNYPSPLIIDEIQYAPELLPYIKIRVDKNCGKNGAYILTGSQIFPLMQGISESLAGRVALFELLGFSLDEIKVGHNKLNTKGCFELIFEGFFPETCVHHVDTNTFCNAYIQTYLERDIRQVKAVHDLNTFQDFLELLAARIGNLLNLNEISKESGMSAPTIRHWLSLLETNRMVYLMRPYFKNVSKRVVKSPKIYFTDTGLVSNILRYPTSLTLQNGPLSGAFFENFIILELLKYKFNYNRIFELYFYRDSNYNEADCILDFGYKKILIEIKKAKTIQTEHYNHLDKIARYLKIDDIYLICNYPRRMNLQGGIRVLPWWCLDEIFKR